MQTCDNCGAQVPVCGKGPDGAAICCVHCIFNPWGCRCQWGEYGVVDKYPPEFYYPDDDFGELDAQYDEWEA